MRPWIGSSVLVLPVIALGACVGEDGPPAGATPTSAAPDGGTDAAIELSCDAINVEPATIEFGEVRVNSSAGRTSKVTVRNSGVQAREFQVSATAPFTAVDGTSQWLGLAAGEARAVELKFTPTAEALASGTLEVTTKDGCSRKVGIKGTGTNKALAVSPTLLDFGGVACGATEERSIEIDAAANVAAGASWQAAIASPFGLANGTGPITPGAVSAIAVTLTVPFTQAGFAATQDLSLTLPGEGVRSIVVRATGRGAVVAFTKPSYDIGGQSSATVQNSGNDVANVTFRATGPITVSPAAFSLGPGGAIDLTLGVAPGAGFNTSASIDFVQTAGAPGAVCSSPPSTVTYIDTNPGTSGGN